MNALSATSPRHAVTLIETLLAVALIALAATFGAGSLATASATADHLAAAATMRDMDRLARLHAVAGGAVDLVLEGAELSIRRGPHALARRTLPRHVAISMLTGDAGRFQTRLAIGSDGRGEDYRVIVGNGNDRVEWAVHGLTGWVSRPRDREGRR
jgi:type II secretory pathway pseudopilin PulG